MKAWDEAPQSFLVVLWGLQVWLLVQQQGGKPPGHNLGPLLHLYKARLALACHNYKAAKKEVRMAELPCHSFTLPCWSAGSGSRLPEWDPFSPQMAHWAWRLGPTASRSCPRCRHRPARPTCTTLAISHLSHLTHVCLLLCHLCHQVRGLLSCDPDSHAAVLLKAQAEAMRQQPKKALKTLAPVLTAAPQATIRYYPYPGSCCTRRMCLICVCFGGSARGTM